MTVLEFWARPHTWPRDPHGYVFLARAVEEIGRAMFGEEWTGKEVTTEHVRSLPYQAQGTVGDASYAHDVLMKLPKHSKQLPSPKTVLPPSLNSVLSRPAGLALFQVDSFTTEQWSAALFAYQSGVLIVGYSYGYFAARDLVRMGACLTVVEFLVLLLLVRFYWPLIGLK